MTQPISASNSSSATSTGSEFSRTQLPMDSQLKDIQPGGGVIIHLEQYWGRFRRCWLRTFRGSYVRRMAACRKGDFNPCPHDVLDPRDLKFHVNQGGWHWDAEADPFTWRDRLPFVRSGLAELFVMCGTAATIAAVSAWFAASTTGWLQIAAALVALTGLVIGVLIAWFFRNPWRAIPSGPGIVVSPADGKIVDIEDIPHDDFIGGPAVKIGIFLSIFNVHINRAPVAGTVIGLRYRPGKYLNALRPESARENEQLAIMIEEPGAAHRGFVVHQITGAIARRIVCRLKPGDRVARGEQFGMIKLGSRTELLMPAEKDLKVAVTLGQHVAAGSTILARYASEA